MDVHVSLLHFAVSVNLFMPGDILDKCHTFEDNFELKHEFGKYLITSCQ